MPRESTAAARRPLARSAAPPGAAITSRDNRWLKLFRSALREGYLPEDGVIGLEGPHLVEEALRSGLELDACLVSPEGERFLAELPSESRRTMRILRTTDRLFKSVSDTEHPQGIATLVRPPEWSFDDLLRGDIPLVVVLVGVGNPGNVGTAVRSAEAFGATGLITTRGTADPWSPKAMRASAGSALRLPLSPRIAPPIALAQLRVAGLKILAATARASNASEQMPGAAHEPPIVPPSELREACAILIGNEGAGLPPEMERAADGLLVIPMAGGVDSLNAGVAASVILYEAARQRRERE